MHLAYGNACTGPMDRVRYRTEYDSSLSACNAVTSFTGRDKVVRLVQYASTDFLEAFPVLGQKKV